MKGELVRYAACSSFNAAYLLSSLGSNKNYKWCDAKPTSLELANVQHHHLIFLPVASVLSCCTCWCSNTNSIQIVNSLTFIEVLDLDWPFVNGLTVVSEISTTKFCSTIRSQWLLLTFINLGDIWQLFNGDRIVMVFLSPSFFGL